MTPVAPPGAVGYGTDDAREPTQAPSDRPAQPSVDVPPARRIGWLRRNGVALVAAALALVVATTVIAVIPLQRSAPPGPDRVIAAGHSFTWNGRVVTLRAAGTNGKHGSTIETPKRAGLIAVLVDVTVKPGAKRVASGYCDIQLTEPGPWLGDDRVWVAESSPSDYRYGASFDNRSTCLLEQPESFVIENVFLVPSGTYGRVALDLEFHAKGQEARLVRFELPTTPKLF